MERGHVLVESNRVIRQAQISQDEEAGEETAKWYHLPEREPYRHEEVERRARGNPKDDGCAGEVPHCECNLHIL